MKAPAVWICAKHGNAIVNPAQHIEWGCECAVMYLPAGTFDDLLQAVNWMLSAYPENVFTGKSGDPGAQLVAALRRVIEAQQPMARPRVSMSAEANAVIIAQQLQKVAATFSERERTTFLTALQRALREQGKGRSR